MKNKMKYILATVAALSGAFTICSFGCGSDDTENAEKIGQVKQGLSYSETMIGLYPSHWYKFNETSGNTLGDSVGFVNGTYYGSNNDSVPMLGNDSGVIGGGTAAHFGFLDGGVRTSSTWTDGGVNSTYNGPHAVVPATNSLFVQDNFSMTKGYDTFTRTIGLGNSLGTPNLSAGSQQWSPLTSVNSWSINGSKAVVEPTPTNTTKAMKFPEFRKDSDTQVKVSWQSTNGKACNASQQTGWYGFTLASRFTDWNNYYSAAIVEYSSKVSLILSKRSSSGGYQQLGIVDMPSNYDCSTWFVRFQVSSKNGRTTPTLKAKWWKEGTPENKDWDVTGTDNGTPLTDGWSAVIVSVGNDAKLNRTFIDEYRVQSPGMTISVWVNPTTDNFEGSTSNACTPPTVFPEGYVNFISKNTPNTETVSNQEWLFRMYSGNSITDAGGCNFDRRWDFSTYALPSRAFAPANQQGPGYRHNTQSDPSGTWHHIVGVYYPGDYLDPRAGIDQYFDGVYHKHDTDLPDGGTTYVSGSRYVDYGAGMMLDRTNTPLRIGAAMKTYQTGTSNAWLQYQGDIDELSIFDYMLDNADVQSIYAFKQ